MTITTKNEIKPIAERMVKGIAPNEREIQGLRAATSEVQDPAFKALLMKVGHESSLRLRREAGKELLNGIRFATGAMLKGNPVPGYVRPEKAKRVMKKSLLQK